MTERKNSASPSTLSKGGAAVFARQVQRKFSRAQEKVLQRFGKSEETRDEQFEIWVQNLHDQQSDGHRIFKDLKAYLNAVKVMRDASSHLFQSLYDVYELEWDGGDDLGAVVEGEDLLWNDYETKLRDQALLTMESYMSQFLDMRERVAKRGRKLVDYDSSRHQLESLENAKKRDDIKIGKAKEEMKAAQKIFEDMNQELKDDLPSVYDSRIGCYVTVFQAISNLRDIFYREMTQNNHNLLNIMKDLKAQHPNKNFVIKNFSRSGSLKRRSLKNALSPRSLKASFSDFHLPYSPRDTLRREYNSSFRSDRGSDEPHSPETSHSKSKHTKDPEHRAGDTYKSSIDNLAADVVPSTTAVTGDSDGEYTARKEDVKSEDEKTDEKEGEPLPTVDPERERKSRDLKDNSSLEEPDENIQKPGALHTEVIDSNTPTLLEAPEDHMTHPEPLSGGKENGITSNHKMDTETFEASCKDTKRTDHMSGEVKEETI